MSLKLYRPTSEGLAPSPVQEQNWRRRLRASRWSPAPLANPEATEVSGGSGILFFGGLGRADLPDHRRRLAHRPLVLSRSQTAQRPDRPRR